MCRDFFLNDLLLLVFKSDCVLVRNSFEIYLFYTPENSQSR